MGINIHCLFSYLKQANPHQVPSIAHTSPNNQKQFKIKKAKICHFFMGSLLGQRSRQISNDLYQILSPRLNLTLLSLFSTLIFKMQVNKYITDYTSMQNTEDIKVTNTNNQLPPINNNSSSGPFKAPNDNQILLNSDNTKSRMKDQKIWDKPTASCRNPLKRFDKFQMPIDEKYVPVNSYNTKQKKLIETALEIIQNRKKNKDLAGKNQTIVDILEQKKEMFLVTMTHGIIQKQIKNLKDQADERERALKDSNEVLAEDIKDFQSFQQNEKNQTKRKQESFEKQVQLRLIKEQQIKNKQITFNSLKAEKSRNEQNIISYEKYKTFLNQLLPQSQILQQQKGKEKRLNDLKERMYKQWLVTQDKKQGEAKLRADFSVYFEKLKESGQNQEIQEILNNEEMYFKEPHQLIQYFNNLEEANLFCIQNVQIAEQKLQQFKVKSKQREIQLNAKYQAQLDQKKALEKQLAELTDQIKVLKKKKEQNSILDEKDNKDIKSTIAAQYQAMKDQMTLVYLPEIQHNAEALALLSGIEICMERLWEKLRQCYLQNPKAVKNLKNEYQKEKTRQKREEATKKNNLEDQKRKQRNLDKKQPTLKIYGRFDMARSAPNEKIVKKKAEVNNKNINDDIQYLLQ